MLLVVVEVIQREWFVGETNQEVTIDRDSQGLH